MKTLFAKAQAKLTIKAMDAKEGVKNFITNEISAKGTTEEGTNTYGGLVIAIIAIALIVLTVKVVFPNIMDFFNKGTTKRPADWV